jgi:hypothetical protein
MADDPTKASDLTAADIPDGIVSTCPLHQMMVSPAATCFGCSHFGGVAILNPSEMIPWEQRHIVLCRYRRKIPMQRVGAPAAAGSIGRMMVR